MFKKEDEGTKYSYLRRVMEVIVSEIKELDEAVKQLLAFAKGKKVFLFSGEIGAGKTTFIQRFCQYFQVNEQVTSPTFSIINEYSFVDENKNESNIYHMDLYRLKDDDEALNIGIEEYLYSEKYCLIEWPAVIENLLPENCVSIHIEITEETTRKMVFSNL